MTRVKIEVEVPEDFEAYTIGCADKCPFGYWDDYESGYRCDYNENDCPMIKAEKQL